MDIRVARSIRKVYLTARLTERLNKAVIRPSSRRIEAAGEIV